MRRPNLLNMSSPQTSTLPTSTDEGRDWLTIALDPFHDFSRRCAGFPDEQVGNTTVQVFRHRISLTAPNSIEGSWDCHISSLPILQGPIGQREINTFTAVPAEQFIDAPSGFQSWKTYENDNAPNYPIGTINIARVPAGSPTWPTINYSSHPLHPDSVFEAYNAVPETADTAPMRIIAAGFEFHNDTPPLYKGGASTTYELTQTTRFEGVEAYSVDKFAYTQRMRMPPATVEEAALVPGAVGLSAEQGIYCPLVLDVHNNDYEMVRPTNVAVVSQDVYPDVFATGTSVPTNVAVVGVPPVNQGIFFNRLRTAAVNTVGCYLTGLPNQSVITLEMVFVVESRPTPANPTLLTLSSPSCPYDREAIELYTKIRKTLPPGVPVSMNAKGDFFRMVKSAAKTFAPKVPGMIGMLSPSLGQTAKRMQIAAQPVVDANRARKANGKGIANGKGAVVAPSTTMRKR